MIIVEIVVSMQFVVCLMISYEFCFLNFYIDFVFCMVDLTICMANFDFNLAFRYRSLLFVLFLVLVVLCVELEFNLCH